MTDRPFRVDLGAMKRRPKDDSPRAVATVDDVGDDHGFVGRPPQKRRGRRPSPRTGQVHAKVLPHVAVDLSNEAKRRGVQQGVIIEEAWALYCARHGLDSG